MDTESPIAARYVGERIPRTEDARLLRGIGRFVDDIVLPGMLHAAFLRSPVARAAIRRIDTTAARAVPGVRAVLTGAELNPLVKSLRPLFWPKGLAYPHLTALAERDVRFAGDAVAIVIAEDRAIAEDAADLIAVEYEETTPVIDYLEARNAPPVHPEIGSNVVTESASPADAELDAIFASAPHVVEAVIYQQTQTAMPMETRGIVVSHEPEQLTLWISTQSPHVAAWRFAEAFGMPQSQVRAYAHDVGGAFGSKAHAHREEVAVAAASRHVGRPVKWIEDRLENLIASTHARNKSATVKMAFDRDGRILAAHLDYRSNTGAWPWTATSGPKVVQTFPGPYRIPKFGYRQAAYYTNTCGRGAYRGPWMFETLSRERFMDIAAEQIGIDPLELRRRNVISQAELPYKSVTGCLYESISPAETLERAAAAADIPSFRALQAAERAKGRHLGLGLSVYMEPTADLNAFRSHNIAKIRIEPTGHAVLQSNAHSQGQSTETTLAQIAADQLGMAFDDVRVLQGDSAQAGFGAGAGGSRQAVIAGGVVTRVAAQLRRKVLDIAAHMLEASASDLRIVDSVVHVTGVPALSVTLREVAERAYFATTLLPEGMEPGLEAQGRYAPERTTWSNAAHACIVEVDIDTGMVKILRWIASSDCGVMINPAVVEGQISGGIAQAIGGVLLEHMAYDARGNPLAATLKDYLPPLADSMPVIEFHPVCTPSRTAGGFKGVGEGGAIVGPSTLMNAIADALSPFGIDCNRLPLSPDRIVMQLHARVAAGNPRIR